MPLKKTKPKHKPRKNSQIGIAIYYPPGQEFKYPKSHPKYKPKSKIKRVDYF